MKTRLEILIKKRPLVSLFFLGWALFFFFLWSNMLSFKDDGLYAGHPYVWADWSMHTGLVSAFAYKPPSLWFSSHPFFAGAPLNYPFVTNLFSGLLVRMGIPMTFAMTVPSFVFSMALLFGLYGVYRNFFRSQKAILAACLLFLCSGGLGFVVAKNLSDPSIVLTKMSESGIEFTNIILGMLVPQRAFLLGMPIGLLIISFITRVFQKKHITSKEIIATGALSGFLPIIHTHTYIVVVLLSAWLFLFSLKAWKKWGIFAASAGTVSLIVYFLFLRSTVDTSAFFSWHPGWYVQTGLWYWILFWFRNWGVFLVLSIVGTVQLFVQKKPERLIIAGWWMVFVVANLIQFQPQTWDNSKFFAWVYVGLAIPAVLVLQTLWRQKDVFMKPLVIILIGGAIFSGAYDLRSMLDFEHQTYRMLSSDEMKLGEWVRQNTSASSVFLSPEMVSNPIPMIGGRNVALGYSGWIFSYGFPYARRQQEIQSFLTGKSDALVRIQEDISIQYLYIPISQIRPSNILESDIVFENPAGKIYSVHSN